MISNEFLFPYNIGTKSKEIVEDNMVSYASLYNIEPEHLLKVLSKKDNINLEYKKVSSLYFGGFSCMFSVDDFIPENVSSNNLKENQLLCIMGKETIYLFTKNHKYDKCNIGELQSYIENNIVFLYNLAHSMSSLINIPAKYFINICNEIVIISYDQYVLLSKYDKDNIFNPQSVFEYNGINMVADINDSLSCIASSKNDLLYLTYVSKNTSSDETSISHHRAEWLSYLNNSNGKSWFAYNIFNMYPDIFDNRKSYKIDRKKYKYIKVTDIDIDELIESKSKKPVYSKRRM